MDDNLQTLANVGSAAGGGGLIAGLMQMLRTKEAREARDALIALQGDVRRLIDDVEKMSALASTVSKTELKVDALHRRLDDVEERLSAFERGKGKSR